MKPETPKRTRLSNDFKLAIIEAAKKKGGKEGYREEAMKTYHISKSAYYNIFRDFEPKVVDSPARGPIIDDVVQSPAKRPKNQEDKNRNKINTFFIEGFYEDDDFYDPS